MASKTKRAKPQATTPQRALLINDEGPIPWITLSWFSSAYIMLLAFAILGFTGSVVMGAGNERAAGQSIFLAVNALTLTGFRYSIGPEQATPVGQVFILLTTCAGWLLTAVPAAMAGRRFLRRDESDWGILFAGVVALVAAMLFGTVALFASRTLMQSSFLSASAFANSALALSEPGSILSRPSLLVLLPLSVAGGAGLLVLLDLWAFAWHARPLSKHANVMLALIGAGFIVGSLFLIVIQFIDSGATVERAATLGAGSLNARGAGFPMHALSDFPKPVAWSFALLIAIGGVSAGGAGGVNLATLRTLSRGLVDLLAGLPVSRIWAVAAIWFIAFVATTVFAFLGVLLTAPQVPVDRIAFIAISASANVGISHEPIALVGAPLLFLSFAMIVGRLLPIALLWYLVSSFETDEVVPL